MLVRNVQTKRVYPVTDENFKKYFEGKENWEKVEEPKTQKIENTVGKTNDLKEKDPKGKTNKSKS